MRSKVVQDILDRITPEEHAEFQKQLEEDMAYNEMLFKQGKIYGTPTSITLDIVREAGFNPIGICWYGGEETLIFSSQREASSAYKKLEKEQGKVFAYWYGKKSFEKEVDRENKFYEPINLEWL